MCREAAHQSVLAISPHWGVGPLVGTEEELVSEVHVPPPSLLLSLYCKGPPPARQAGRQAVASV